MRRPVKQPTVSVGLLATARSLDFQLEGEFVGSDSKCWPPGRYVAWTEEGRVRIRSSQGEHLCSEARWDLEPRDGQRGRFTIHGVTIGIGFHWERQEIQTFQGELQFKASSPADLTVINRVPIEAYLTSVISSEMNATSPQELLKAHAVVSRSWLLAQLSPWKAERRGTPSMRSRVEGEQATPATEIIRWYARGDHADFDVCADDHCQRYQGVTKAVGLAVAESVAATHGLILTLGEEVCDTRFSKCCGGMTEEYWAAWEDVEVPYLKGVPDRDRFPKEYRGPLTVTENAKRWILGSPPGYCNTSGERILSQVLPGFDQETRDFFRWEVVYEQEEIQSLIASRLDLDLGRIVSIEAVERGVSGRIVRLRVTGQKGTVTVGKELEIRRTLSRSHLYSSAFIVEPIGTGEVPARFRLQGAGWGHGVGLCQIGAAVMALEGKTFSNILGHYYRGASLFQMYS